MSSPTSTTLFFLLPTQQAPEAYIPPTAPDIKNDTIEAVFSEDFLLMHCDSQEPLTSPPMVGFFPDLSDEETRGAS
ncbi:hypothetical protein CLU79DRAFT_840691 [Phycomyces nitens]|nr:hypothetical protein CLU79DRAFT_840691 [Phycomyces nitens]